MHKSRRGGGPNRQGAATAEGSFPCYTRPERISDLAVHVTGMGLAAVALPPLLVLGVEAGTAAVVGLSLYAIGLAAMLTFSALYNAVQRPGPKAVLRRLDRAAIFVMIAGTYSPFLLVKVEGAWATGLFAMIWSLAIAGIALVLIAPRWVDRIALGLCLVMGWSIVVVLEPLIAAVERPALALLLVGGLIYTAGIGFHLSEGRFHNVLWHVCVLAAAACHYAAILGSVAMTAA